jgi:hypothetical protein
LTVFITEAGDTFINGVGIVYTDLILASGIAHLIDDVLNPDAIITPPGNGTEDGVPGFGDHPAPTISAAGEGTGSQPTESADAGKITGVAATSGADASHIDGAATAGATSLNGVGTSESGAGTTSVASVNNVALAVAPLKTDAVGAVALFGGTALAFNL